MLIFSSQDIPNLLIITDAAEKNESYDLITNTFSGRWNTNLPVHLDIFDGQLGQFVKNVNLFPDKTTNLNERILRIAMFGYKPYAFWEEVVSASYTFAFIFQFSTAGVFVCIFRCQEQETQISTILRSKNHYESMVRKLSCFWNFV